MTSRPDNSLARERLLASTAGPHCNRGKVSRFRFRGLAGYRRLAALGLLVGGGIAAGAGVPIALVIAALGVGLALGAALYVRRRCRERRLAALAVTARAVSYSHDYSLRVPDLGPGHLGELGRDFNMMLVHVEQANAELQAEREELERRVAERLTALQAESVARRRVEERNRLLAHAVQGSREPIWINDPEGRLLFANRAFLEAFGYREDEVVGGDAGLVDIVEGLPSPPPEEDGGALRDGWQGEVVTRRRDGAELPLDLSTSLVHEDDGRVVGRLSVARDISERRELEAQLRQAAKMEAVGRLAGGVAHDFNNLLGVIQGYGELLIRRLPEGDPSRDKLEQIVKASGKAANLTRQLLAFSRRQVIEPKVLGLNAVVADAEKLIRRLVGEDIEVALALDPLLGRVRADPGQVDQVLINLAANSRDAMPRGGTLSIRTTNVTIDEEFCRRHLGARPGRYARLEVGDDGTGIDPDTLGHVFEPFFTTKERGRGTGLGLATVYGIVKQSNGYVWVESMPGRTVFRIDLPLVEEEAVPERPAPEPAASTTGEETILLVEDEDSLRELAAELLVTGGYRVLAASGGAEALRLAEAHPGPIRLLLSDVVMPGMSGPELAVRLRTLRPGIEVLFMSGYPERAIAEHGVLRSGTRLLAKPFTLEALTRAVDEALGGEAEPAGAPALAG